MLGALYVLENAVVTNMGVVQVGSLQMTTSGCVEPKSAPDSQAPKPHRFVLSITQMSVDLSSKKKKKDRKKKRKKAPLDTSRCWHDR
jgi:hypothetical protein